MLGTWFRSLLEGRDEHRARQLRTDLGRLRWLVSWQRTPSGFWLARVSAPEIRPTIERSGTTRCRAIRRATRVLTHILDDASESRPRRMYRRRSGPGTS